MIIDFKDIYFYTKNGKLEALGLTLTFSEANLRYALINVTRIIIYTYIFNEPQLLAFIILKKNGAYAIVLRPLEITLFMFLLHSTILYQFVFVFLLLKCKTTSLIVTMSYKSEYIYVKTCKIYNSKP